jgi:hypothetical protein
MEKQLAQKRYHLPDIDPERAKQSATPAQSTFMINRPVDFLEIIIVGPAAGSQQFFQEPDFMGRDHAGIPVMGQKKMTSIGAKTAMSADLDPGL